MRGVTTAAQLVEYCQAQPPFREISQPKFLAATTTKRSYKVLTKADIDDCSSSKTIRSRLVEQLQGVSKYKQAFSTVKKFHLMVCLLLPELLGW